MGMRINTNTEALNTLRQLNTSSKMYATSMQRLSSGKRINSAADDAAGYAISQKLLGQSKGLDQASSNAQDGISMLQTANGGLQTIQDMLQRLRQLAVQSANDTNTSSDRANLQSEADQISQEITQIASTTQFNTKNLLDGTIGKTAAVAALTGIANAPANTSIPAAQTGSLLADTYTLSVTAGTAATAGTASTLAAVAGSKGAADAAAAITSTTAIDSQTAGLETTANGTSNTSAVGLDVSKGTTLTVKGEGGTTAAITLTAGETFGALAAAISSSSAGVTASVGANGLTLTNAGSNTATNIQVTGSDNTLKALGLVAAGAGASTNSASTLNGTGAVAAVAAVLSTATLTGAAAGNTSPITLTNTGNVFSDNNSGFKLDLAGAGVSTVLGTGTASIVVTDHSATLQVGANAGQTLTVGVGDMRAQALGVQGATSNKGLDISTSSSVAQNAISTIDYAIQTVSTQAASLGAMQNRVQNAINNLNIGSENMQAAYSSITNVNMAQESTNLATAQILNQSGIAMLAQANQSPQLVLKLLG